MTVEKVALGRRLFYDTRLSGNGTRSCASCHRPELAFTDGRARAVGSTGEIHARGAMSLVNSAYSPALTWADPTQRRLEDQALVPMTNEDPVELGLKGREAEVLGRLARDPAYPDLFARAFPGDRDPIHLANVQKAIASFERTLLSADSPYDRLVWRDDRDALSEQARRGMELFFSERVGCARCHGGPTLAGPIVAVGGPDVAPAFPRNGLAPGADPGLAKVSGHTADRGRFRVPTLRNIAVTAPYMHDGRLPTLEAVIDHYASASASAAPGTSDLPAPYTLDARERCDLVAFLESLTDATFLADPRNADPFVDGDADAAGSTASTAPFGSGR
jgi:cytochrome c peroxidase